MDRDRSLALGLAAGGVVGGHALAYLLAYPLAAAREAHLAATGHRDFPFLLMTGLLAAGLALSATFARALRRERLAPRVGTLLRLQLGLFLGLELCERRFDLPATMSDPGVLVGLAVLAVLAVALAWLARGVIAVARRLTATPTPAWLRGPASVPPPARVAEPVAPDPVALGPRRAPPAFSVA